MNYLEIILLIVSIKMSYGDSGTATFYNNQNNACQFNPSLYGDYLKVAISGNAWQNSIACGTCLNIQGTGNGIGTTPFTQSRKAIVINLCSECENNHYDLLLEGNGIWNINYQIIPCDQGIGPIQYRTDSNEPHYFRLQVINTKTPVTNLYLEGHSCEKTFDNFWVHHDPSQLGQDVFRYPLNINFVTQDGEQHYGTVYNNNNYIGL
jgi:hypothetical protein